MLGEITQIIESTYEELVQLRDEREMFVLANEDTLHEFIFHKKLNEYDERIKKLTEDLIAFEEEKRDIIRQS